MRDFATISVEDREDWQASPVTEALIGLIYADRKREVENLVSTLKDTTADKPARLDHLGGRLAAYDEILQLITRK